MMRSCCCCVDAARCYVRLHGYGLAENVAGLDWYLAMNINGVEHVNVTRPAQGLFTYILDPSTCSASDSQHFNMFTDAGASTTFVNYIQALADGIIYTPIFTFM